MTYDKSLTFTEFKMFSTETAFDYEMKMSQYATEAQEAISRIVTKENMIDFTEMLAFTWNECELSAKKIAQRLNLRKIHLLAIQDEMDLFIEEYSSECEENDERLENFYIEDFENLMGRF